MPCQQNALFIRDWLFAIPRSSEQLMTNRDDFGTQVNRWIDDAAGDPSIRVTAARDSIGIHKAWRPVLFGAGALGCTILQGLRKSEVEPLGFVDNNPRRWGTSVDSVSVMSLAQAIDRFGHDVPIVVAIYTGASLQAQLRASGFDAIAYPQLALAFPDTLLPWNALELPSRMVQHRARIHDALALFEDDRSRDEFVAQIRFRATLSGPVPSHLSAQTTYFPDELVSLRADECFVDCGAFDGDSIDSFLRRSRGWFGTIVAIEADPSNAEKLRRYLSGLPHSVSSKVMVVEAAVGAKSGSVRFAATGSVASTVIGQSGPVIEVPCKMLDDILQDTKPSYIKMDLEGAEPEALAGAREVIRHHAPVMALSLYHRQSDLWDIPLLVKEISDRYQFFLRRHSDDCWEQILYAIPHDRVQI